MSSIICFSMCTKSQSVKFWTSYSTFSITISSLLSQPTSRPSKIKSWSGCLKSWVEIILRSTISTQLLSWLIWLITKKILTWYANVITSIVSCRWASLRMRTHLRLPKRQLCLFWFTLFKLIRRRERTSAVETKTIMMMRILQSRRQMSRPSHLLLRSLPHQFLLSLAIYPKVTLPLALNLTLLTTLVWPLLLVSWD